MKKNNFKSLAAVLSLAMAATAMPANVEAAKAPKLTVSSTTVYSGKTYSMTVKNLKKGYTVQFSSSEGGVKFANTKKIKAKGAKVSSKFTVKAAKSIANNTKTKIKAVVRNANGKKVKSVTKTVTLKQLAKSITLKDIAEKTVTVGTVVNADATISPKAAKGAYKKTFTSSNSSVLEVTNASTGLFKAVAPGTATISVSAANGSNAVESGSIEITVIEAEEQKPDTKPDDSNNQDENKGPDQTTGASISTDSAINTEFTLDMKASKTEVTADSKDQSELTLTLKAPDGYEVNSNMLVSAKVVLGTPNAGNLSTNEVTLTFDNESKTWVGHVLFTSATLEKTTICTIDASISTVLNGPTDGKQVEGVKLAKPVEITLKPAAAQQVVEQSGGVVATKAVVESCDRIEITFNNDILPSDFYTADGQLDNGEVAEKLADGSSNYDSDFKLYVQQNAKENDNFEIEGVEVLNAAGKKTGIEKYNIAKDVKEIQQGSDTNKLVFILKNGAELQDNQKFRLKFVDSHTGRDYKSEILTNYITDTSKPKLLKVEVKNQKSLELTFDQPVVTYAANGTLKSVQTLSNYTIDGQNLGELSYKALANGKVKSLFGDPSDIKVALAKRSDDATKDDLARNRIVITLGKATALRYNDKKVVDADGNKVNAKDGSEGKSIKDITGKEFDTTLEGQTYFEPGEHTILVKNIGDYASLSDDGDAQNRIDATSLNFTVPENTTTPQIESVVAQSPEQFIVEFNCEVTELSGVGIGKEVPADTAKLIQLCYRDSAPANDTTKAMSDYANVTGLKEFDTQTALGVKVTKIENAAESDHTRLKLEITKDWTRLNEYVNYNRQYNNYRFAVKVDAEKLTNAANGLKNALISRPVGTTEMAYDGISPQLTDSGIIILENSKNKCVFDVEFDEPVQGKNSVFDAQYGWTITPRRTTDQMSDISVQVYDQTSKRTYNGTVLGYGNLENTRIRVETDSLPAGHDYTLYVTGVSDDVGNTTGTVNKAFNIDADAAVDSEFKVLSIFADKDYTVDTASDKISHYGVIDLDKTGNGKGNTAKEAIYVEFSEGFKLAPITNTVLQPTNWTVNGTPLTSDNADILSGIPYVEGGNRQMYANGVTIVLPAGFLKDVENVVVKLSSSVQGVSGKNISGKTTLSTPSIFSGSYFNKQVNTDMEVINLTEGDTIKTVLNNTPNLVENN